MSNVGSRLIAEKQRVIRAAALELGLGEEDAELLSLKLLSKLHVRGYTVGAVGGDRVWYSDEQPPEVTERLEADGWQVVKLEPTRFRAHRRDDGSLAVHPEEDVDMRGPCDRLYRIQEEWGEDD